MPGGTLLHDTDMANNIARHSDCRTIASCNDNLKLERDLHKKPELSSDTLAIGIGHIHVVLSGDLNKI